MISEVYFTHCPQKKKRQNITMCHDYMHGYCTILCACVLENTHYKKPKFFSCKNIKTKHKTHPA